MSALGTIWLPLKYMSAAHKLSAPSRLYIPAHGLQQHTKREEINRLDIPRKPENKGSAVNARVHSQAKPGQFDATEVITLEELRHG